VGRGRVGKKKYASGMRGGRGKGIMGHPANSVSYKSNVLVVGITGVNLSP